MAVTSGGGWVATGGESPVKSTTAEAPPRRRRGVRVVDIVVEKEVLGTLVNSETRHRGHEQTTISLAAPAMSFKLTMGMSPF